MEERIYKTSEDYRAFYAMKQRAVTEEAHRNFLRVAQLKRLTEKQCRRLTEEYTLTEIEAGEWKDGKFVPKELVVVSRNLE